MAFDSKYYRSRKGALPSDYPKKDPINDTWRSIKGNPDGSSDIDTGTDIQTRTRVNDPGTTTRIRGYQNGGPVKGRREDEHERVQVMAFDSKYHRKGPKKAGQYVKAYQDGGPVKGRAGQYVAGETKGDRLATASRAQLRAYDEAALSARTDGKKFEKDLESVKRLGKAWAREAGVGED